MASYWRYMSANYQHGCSIYKELDLDCFETSEEKVAYLLERCRLQEKDRRSLMEEVSHLEDQLEMRNLENRQLKKNNYKLEVENAELKYECNQSEKKAQKLVAQLKEDYQFEKGDGGEKDGNLLSSVRRGDYLVRHTSETGNPSAKEAAARPNRLIPGARTSEVSNEGDLKAQLEGTQTKLMYQKDRADFLQNLIVQKLALADQVSRQTNEVPMAEGVAHGVPAARVLPEASPPAGLINNATSSMNGNTTGVRRADDEDEGDQVVPTG